MLLAFDLTAHAQTDSARVDRLFMWATAGDIRFAAGVQPAKDSLAAMGPVAARWLAFKLRTSDARERRALSEIFQKIGPVATPYLVPCLDSSGEDMPANTANALGLIGDTAAVEPLIAHLGHREHRVRSEVATALGKTKDKRAVDSLIVTLQTDDDSDVRKSAAVALGSIGDSSAAPALVRALEDPFYGVRLSAQRSLTRLVPPPSGLLIDAISVLSGAARYCAVVALGGCPDAAAHKTLLHFLGSPDPYERGFAIEGLAIHPSQQERKRVDALKRKEKDPFVRAQMERLERRAEANQDRKREK
ncbi:MAG: HEAT repeat domain-containing protein [Candidatus Zixiibacteriota bacterium]